MQSRRDHRKGSVMQPDGEPDYVSGRVFFDKETELAGFSDAIVRNS